MYTIIPRCVAVKVVVTLPLEKGSDRIVLHLGGGGPRRPQDSTEDPSTSTLQDRPTRDNLFCTNVAKGGEKRTRVRLLLKGSPCESEEKKASESEADSRRWFVGRSQQYPYMLR